MESKNNKNLFIFYLIAILLGIIVGMLNISYMNTISKICSEMFIKMFRCISMPFISLSIIMALCYNIEQNITKIGRKTLFYTISTTLIATIIAAILYIAINPLNINITSNNIDNIEILNNSNGYLKYFLDVIPDGIVKSFIEYKVFSVLLISIIFGLGIRRIKEEEIRNTVINFFKGIHDVFLYIINSLIKILPIGIFGFVSISVNEINTGFNLHGIEKYFLIIILANLIQGIIVLPTLLAIKDINPWSSFKGMLPALLVAFFSKSSSGTLPITIKSAENNLKINSKVSNFVLPLCTTINMNGCAVFIFSTVVYIMQNNGIPINFTTIISFIIISTLAAIGNAGVPMGCFFLSVSLLSSMNMHMELLGIILPFYSLLDMLETMLNVWSDSCITAIINKENIKD